MGSGLGWGMHSGLWEPSQGAANADSAGEGSLDIAVQLRPAGGAGVTQEKEAGVSAVRQQRGRSPEWLEHRGKAGGGPRRWAGQGLQHVPVLTLELGDIWGPRCG